MKIRSALAAAASLALLLPTATTTLAHDQPRPDGGRGGRFDPEAFRKMMADRTKAALKVTDEEWTVLSPMIEKINEKASAARGGFGRTSFGGGSGGPGGPGGSGGSGGSSGGGDRGPG